MRPSLAEVQPELLWHQDQGDEEEEGAVGVPYLVSLCIICVQRFTVHWACFVEDFHLRQRREAEKIARQGWGGGRVPSPQARAGDLSKKNQTKFLQSGSKFFFHVFMVKKICCQNKSIFGTASIALC